MPDQIRAMELLKDSTGSHILGSAADAVSYEAGRLRAGVAHVLSSARHEGSGSRQWTTRGRAQALRIRAARSGAGGPRLAEDLKQAAIEEGRWTEKRDFSGIVNMDVVTARLDAGRQRVAERKVARDAAAKAKA